MLNCKGYNEKYFYTNFFKNKTCHTTTSANLKVPCTIYPLKTLCVYKQKLQNLAHILYNLPADTPLLKPVPRRKGANRNAHAVFV